MNEQKEPKKRTSKKSKIAENTITITTINNEEPLLDTIEKQNQPQVEVICKKRGRKPKGGKIISDTSVQENIVPVRPNVILHLKCSVKDLNTTGEYNSNFTSSNIDPYNTDTIKSEYGQYSIDDLCIINKPTQNEVVTTTDEHIDNTIIDTKDIWKKLKMLEHNLHVNNISDKKSACFWCSYDFDNPSIYIPKYQSKDTYHVYGCFCSPECAVAYLMNENIDNSVRFERYALLNHMYSKIYEYSKNIKPAPNPHYILEKYYGNLTIQEYRALLKSHRLYLMIDKPLTRILPEYYDDNDDFIINNKVIPSSIQNQLKKTLRPNSSNQLFYDGL
jgi:hypothetical protein